MPMILMFLSRMLKFSVFSTATALPFSFQLRGLLWQLLTYTPPRSCMLKTSKIYKPRHIVGWVERSNKKG